MRALAVDEECRGAVRARLDGESEDQECAQAPLPEEGCEDAAHADDDGQDDAPGDDRPDQGRVRQPARAMVRQEAHEALVRAVDATVMDDHSRHEQPEQDRHGRDRDEREDDSCEERAHRMAADPRSRRAAARRRSAPRRGPVPHSREGVRPGACRGRFVADGDCFSGYKRVLPGSVCDVGGSRVENPRGMLVRSTHKPSERIRPFRFSSISSQLSPVWLPPFSPSEWYARSSVTPVRPALETARAVGEAVRPHPTLRRLLVRRLDRSVATGFLLTLALACSLVGGVLLGVLAYLVRSVPAVQNVDNSVAGWGFDHRTSLSTSGLHAITRARKHPGRGRSRARCSRRSISTAPAAAGRCRSSSPSWQEWRLLMHGVKDLVGRVRPALDPAAASLGPSFPSGHSATAAAFYAAAALILGRTLQQRRTASPDRARRRNRRRGRRKPRAPRPPLALRRRRRPRTRMGLVRALRRHCSAADSSGRQRP